jgi:hypothetical protein
MKRLTLLLIAACIMLGDVHAQLKLNPNKVDQYRYHPIWSSNTYAASQNDTSGAFNIGGGPLSEWSVYNDSTNIITRVQWRASSAEAWATVKLDTLDHTGGGAVTGSTYRKIVLRNYVADVFTGVGGQIRIIKHFQATVIGVTTPTYSTQIRY